MVACWYRVHVNHKNISFMHGGFKENSRKWNDFSRLYKHDLKKYLIDRKLVIVRERWLWIQEKILKRPKSTNSNLQNFPLWIILTNYEWRWLNRNPMWAECGNE